MKVIISIEEQKDRTEKIDFFAGAECIASFPKRVDVGFEVLGKILVEAVNKIQNPETKKE